MSQPKRLRTSRPVVEFMSPICSDVTMLVETKPTVTAAMPIHSAGRASRRPRGALNRRPSSASTGILNTMKPTPIWATLVSSSDRMIERSANF